MYELDFNTPAKIHFTGIGGISMSGLAEIMLSKGFTVTGSDSRESEITKHLESLGATIYYGQKASNVAADTEVLIYTAAVKADNPELVAATQMNIPLLTRSDYEELPYCHWCFRNSWQDYNNFNAFTDYA